MGDGELTSTFNGTSVFLCASVSHTEEIENGQKDYNWNYKIGTSYFSFIFIGLLSAVVFIS